MNEDQKNKLQEAGLDPAMALNNFMNNEKMLVKFLGKYLDEKSFPNLVQAMADNDHDAAKMAAHTHKSVCGTLGCAHLNQLIVEQELAMRADDWEKAQQMMPQIEAEHAKIIEVIKNCGLA